MKLKSLCAIGIITIVLSGCGGGSSQSNPTSVPAAPATSDASSSESSALYEDALASSSSGFDGSSYSDTGTGVFYLVNESGTTEDLEKITVYVQSDTLLTQIGCGTKGFDGSLLSYVYVDGMFKFKEQFGDYQGSIDLEADLLTVGDHKVEVVQYEGNDESGTVITYKSAVYEIIEG